MGPRAIPSDNRPRLHHRKSAKVLIAEYERSIQPRPGALPAPSPPAMRLELSAAPASASFHPRRRSSASLPLRRSIKNLLSLLKRGKNDNPIFPTTALALRTSAAAPLEVKELPLLPLSLGDAQRPVLSRSQTEMGSLIYLTSSSFDSTTPIWTSSMIILKGGKISVSWFTPGGVACRHEISLLGCSDIRSVSDLRSLGSKERDALPSAEGEDLKVFELLFKDRRPAERFAVVSVRERAKWISAFWNAILPGGERASGPVENEDPVPPSLCTSASSSSAHSPTKPRTSRPLPSRTNTDRSLPPIPISRTPSRPVVPPLSIPSKSDASLNLDGTAMARTSTNMTSNTLLLPPPPSLPMPISPVSAYSTASALPSPVRSAPLRHWPQSISDNQGNGGSSGASSVASAPSLVRRANSPSITNLSRLSVVKERLAQLERTQSAHTAFSPRSSHRRLGRGGRRLGRNEGHPSIGPEEELGTTGVTVCERGEEDPWKEQQPEAGALQVAFTAKFNSLSEMTDGLPVSLTLPSDKSPGKRATGDGGLEKRHILDGITAIQRVLGGSQSHRPLDGSHSTTTIHQVTLGLDHRLKGANEALKEVKSTLDGIEKRLDSKVYSRRTPAAGDDAASGHEEVLKALRGVRAQLDASLPGLETKISEIGKRQEIALTDGAPPPPAMTSFNLRPVQKQLDDLIKLSSSTRAIVEDQTASKGLLSEVIHLTSLMEGDRAHREQQLLQQADSVRYLNELNTWLETFVNNGASHIQGLAAGIDKLCADFAAGRTALTGGESGCTSSSGPLLLNDVRQLILGMKARDQTMASLQAAVNDLVVAVGSETRTDSQALAQLIESHQRNQESMLKLFTDEISDEIKGERLRFVEAMKEATAINVQLHVEQLKNEMGKEVFVMAKEVERLHRDKQEVEQRIADLMAFYSNQAPMSVDDGYTHPQHSMKPVANLRMKPLGSNNGQASSRSQRRQPTNMQARPLPFPRGTY